MTGGFAPLSTVAVIPARYQSSRLPGKPLLKAAGRTLIEHVWRRTRKATRVSRVLIATDDPRILRTCEEFGAEARLTSQDHTTGSDRIGELLPELHEDVILNVQGDEPEIDPDLLDRLISHLESDAGISVATASCPFPEEFDPEDRNTVKVVTDARGRALYFSRAPIPGNKVGEQGGANDWPQLHLGVYAFRRDALREFLGLEKGSLENAESLEQLRLLEHGLQVGVVSTVKAPAGVDTPSDFEAFRNRAEGPEAERLRPD